MSWYILQSSEYVGIKNITQIISFHELDTDTYITGLLKDVWAHLHDLCSLEFVSIFEVDDVITYIVPN